MTILLCYGTRPEAIKLGPVAAELKALGAPFHVVCTGQHTSLLRGTPAESDLAGASSLGLASTGNVLRYLRKAEAAVEAWLADRPDYLVVTVQGDTMSALAVARAANEQHRLLVHVEAGVRSGDRENPWPEEDARVEITKMADWHFAPTTHAFANLLAEGVPHNRIRLTGNTVVSALARYSNAHPSPAQKHILVTMHRREWLDGPTAEETIEALFDVAAKHPDYKFIWPVHPAVTQKFAGRFQALGTHLLAVPPMPYEKAVGLLATATGVITDSGGLQEEAATLGVPCAVLRRVTDRPELVASGMAIRYNPDAMGVRHATEMLLEGRLPRKASVLYGDPNAAKEVARALAQLDGFC